jgi:hypothetical protein
MMASRGGHHTVGLDPSFRELSLFSSLNKEYDRLLSSANMSAMNQRWRSARATELTRYHRDL